jgi:hypothetical protein
MFPHDNLYIITVFLDLSEKNERASFISIPGLIWRNAEFVNTG